jgi:hypothetical protein
VQNESFVTKEVIVVSKFARMLAVWGSALLLVLAAVPAAFAGEDDDPVPPPPPVEITPAPPVPTPAPPAPAPAPAPAPTKAPESSSGGSSSSSNGGSDTKKARGGIQTGFGGAALAQDGSSPLAVGLTGAGLMVLTAAGVLFRRREGAGIRS